MTPLVTGWPEVVARWLDGALLPGQPPVVAPPSLDGVAQVLTTAGDEGWRVALAGRSGWEPAGPAADLVLSTRRLTDGESIASADLVATVPAGCLLADVQRRLAAERVWLAIDPPGPDRSLGSVISTATSGGLATGFGAIREHVLGMTVVTGDGRILRPGGRVVKNVAGFDLSRLMTGSFGAWGVITSVHVRLRARPEGDETVLLLGDRDDLLAVSDRLRHDNLLVDAATLAGRDARWTLGVRVTGSTRRRQALLDGLRTQAGSLKHLDADRASSWWTEQSEQALAAGTTIRIGATATDLPRAVGHALELKPAHVAAHLGAGIVRVTTDAPAGEIAEARAAAVAQGLTWITERSVHEAVLRLGRYAAPPPEQQPLFERLRRSFDPHRVLVSTLFPP